MILAGQIWLAGPGLETSTLEHYGIKQINVRTVRVQKKLFFTRLNTVSPNFPSNKRSFFHTLLTK